MTKAWTRDQWGIANWCAYVEAGLDRAARAARLAEVPFNFRNEVEAHVRCVFQVRASAQAKRLAAQTAR
jgi:hypothetical protein